MVARSGVVTRPAGSDSYPPAPGTQVVWTLAPILIRLGESAESLGWTVYSIGNIEHLKLHGDHTPWSAGKTRGIVYAIDVIVPDGLVLAFQAWLLAYCRSDVDTSWIDFFNFNGSQYNYAGQRLAVSTDHHLHLSVRKGKENAISALFSAWKAYREPPAPPVRKGKTTMKLVKVGTAFYKTDGWSVEHVKTMPEVENLRKVFGAEVELASLAGLGEVVS